jgi:hypothetical protein
VLIYDAPTIPPLKVTLQGKVQVNPGKTVSFTHPLGTLYFGLEEVTYYTVPTLAEQFDRRLGKANQAKCASDSFDAAIWGLKHGLIDKYYKAIDQVLTLDPNHEEARRALEVKQKMAEPIEDAPTLERDLRELGPRKQMKVARSPHFILLYDTPDKPREGRRKPRHEERLALLEQVYESFLLMFFSRGVELEVPRERMKVILFDEHKDYLTFSTSLSPTLASASGFFIPSKNISVFFDHSTNKQFKQLTEISADLLAKGKEAQRLKSPAARDFNRLGNALDVLFRMLQENEDITTVSHEATHQMAGNTGLFPLGVRVPSWVHEGLATYFEAPAEATWSGIGAVNEERIQWYRALSTQPRYSNIDFIVSDQIFSLAASHGAKLHAYGQAWALTHFLLERRFDEFFAYYRAIGELPRDLPLNPDFLKQLFDRVFSENRQAIDQEWRLYMDSLKTDLEQIRQSKS